MAHRDHRYTCAFCDYTDLAQDILGDDIGLLQKRGWQVTEDRRLKCPYCVREDADDAARANERAMREVDYEVGESPGA